LIAGALNRPSFLMLGKEDMKTRNACTVVLLVIISGTAAYASMYRWPQHIRPPISIDRAHTIALAKLGDTSNRFYCVQAILNGNKEQDGKLGVWNFIFASEDGQKNGVSVDMNEVASMQ